MKTQAQLKSVIENWRKNQASSCKVSKQIEAEGPADEVRLDLASIDIEGSSPLICFLLSVSCAFKPHL
jgi:hypothetical protein